MLHSNFKPPLYPRKYAQRPRCCRLSVVLSNSLKTMESSPSPLPGNGQGEPSPAASPIPDRRSPSPELPLTMTASAVLSNLPRDATSAIASAGQFSQEKVLVRFKPVGAAPSLSREVCKISAAQRFEAVVAYLRRVLKVKDTDSVFLYVNSAFAPSLDEIVGNLHRVSSQPFLPYSASRLMKALSYSALETPMTS